MSASSSKGVSPLEKMKAALRRSSARTGGTELVDTIWEAIPDLDDIERQQVLAQVLRKILMPAWHAPAGQSVRKIFKVWSSNIRNLGPGKGVEYTWKCHEKSDALFDDWLHELRQARKGS